MIGVVSHQKNIEPAPSYAYIIKDNEDNGFTYHPGDRYDVVWSKNSKLYAYNEPCEENEVEFNNQGIWGGCVRTFVNKNKYDGDYNAFTYVYYTKTKDLYCIALKVDEARFGGLVVTPASWHPLVKKFTRHQYLMNKWCKLTPLIGKWSLFFNILYTEITYRPGNLGANSAFIEFKNHKIMRICKKAKPNER